MIARRITSLFCLTVLSVATLRGQVAVETVPDDLAAAKVAHQESRSAAKTALTQAMDRLIRTAAAAGNLEELKVLTAHKDAFVTAGILPNLATLSDAVAQYSLAMRKADGQLVGAYETAIQAYNDAKKFDAALNLRKERQQLLSGQPDGPNADSPEAVAMLLDRAKSDYRRSVDESRTAYVTVISTRITAMTAAGDLNGVKRLTDAKAAAEADNTLPDGTNDSQVLGARNRYSAAVQLANQKLTSAYRDAIRNFTRLKYLDRAEAVQKEMEAIGLTTTRGDGAAPASPGVSTDVSSKLSRTLPAFLAAVGTFGAEKVGIRPAKDCIIATRTADFLSKDFVFDMHVEVPKNDEWVVVGIGDTTEKGSIRVVIRNDHGHGRQAFLTLGDTWGKSFGKVRSEEPYVVRFQRIGGPVTVSVGAIENGKFVPEMTQTVSNPLVANPNVSEKRAKLYFSGQVVFTEVRLATGVAAVGASGFGGATVRSPDAPVRFPEPGAPKAQPGAKDPAEGAFLLNNPKLPPDFIATGTFSVTAEGMSIPDGGTKIVTKAEDYLSKDFVLDLWVNVPKTEWVVAGLGDMTNEGSLRVVIRPNGDSPAGVALTLGDEWGKSIGSVRTPGPRVIRLERHGKTVTVSVGVFTNGAFEPEVSRTVQDVKAAVAQLSERRAKLFFTGKSVWTKVRLVTGDAANVIARVESPATPKPVIVDTTAKPAPEPAPANPPAQANPTTPAVPVKPNPPKRTEITVTAKNLPRSPVSTGIQLKAGDKIVFEPNLTDKWKSGKDEPYDYRGRVDRNKGFMAMHWRIGKSGGRVTAGATIAAPEDGELLLYCEDDKSADNSGQIRVVVVLP